VSSRTVRHVRMLAHAQGARARGGPNIEHCSGPSDGGFNGAPSAENSRLAGEAEPVVATSVLCHSTHDTLQPYDIHMPATVATGETEPVATQQATSVPCHITLGTLEPYASHMPATVATGELEAVPTTGLYHSPHGTLDDFGAVNNWCRYGSHLPATAALGQSCAVCNGFTKQCCVACTVWLCSNKKKHRVSIDVGTQPTTVDMSCSQLYHWAVLLPLVLRLNDEIMTASLLYALKHYPQTILDDQKRVLQVRCDLCGHKASHKCLDCRVALCTVPHNFLLETPGTQSPVVVTRTCNDVWHTELTAEARALYCGSSREAADNWLRSSERAETSTTVGSLLCSLSRLQFQ